MQLFFTAPATLNLWSFKALPVQGTLSKKLPMSGNISDLPVVITFTDANLNKANVFSLFLLFRSLKIPQCQSFLSCLHRRLLCCSWFVDSWEIIRSQCRIHEHNLGPSALRLPCEALSRRVPRSPREVGMVAAASAAHIARPKTLWAQHCLSSFGINRFDECESIRKDFRPLGKCLSSNCLLIGKQLILLIIKILSPEKTQPRFS